METKLIKINPKCPENEKIQEAAKIIQKGGLVAFPTETVYGLGANGLNEDSVKKIFIAKNRPADNPLILHISDKDELKKLVDKVPSLAEKLIKKFWPGPLTIVIKKSKIVPNIVTCGLDCVAVRMPKNKIALELIRASGCPIAAPSANISGKPSPTMAKHVVDDLWNKIDAIIDGGIVNIGVESTVIDLTVKVPVILRPGKITKKQIEKVIGKVEIANNNSDHKPKSPGMKYKHYSPNAQVIIAKSDSEIKKLIKLNKNKKIKILNYYNEILMARNLYKDFREADKLGYDLILVKKVKEIDFGNAIMDRIKKASGI